MHKAGVLEASFVLHRRAYRDTSMLVELFTMNHGRITVIAKGVRCPSSRLHNTLQPFVPLFASWTGRSDLMVLTYAEVKQGVSRLLLGNDLISAFYANELLLSLLEPWDAHQRLYACYEKLINALHEHCHSLSAVLRSFEKSLLEELGYGLFPTNDAALANAFLAEHYYRFIAEEGWVWVKNRPMKNEQHQDDRIFLGRHLLAIAKEMWADATILHQAKRLFYLAIAILLGHKKIHSRRLLVCHPLKRGNVS